MSLKPPASSPKPLLLDGATGTELGRRGVDISLPLWSARALLEAPEVLQAVHRDYFAAGAKAVTANTFRTHRRSLARAGMSHRGAELTRLAVEIAKAARDEHAPDALVLGSVAPLEDCYQPALAPDEPTCRAEHAEMIGNLLDAGVDVILIETMNNLPEARAAAREAQRLAPSKWIISFCTKSHGPVGILLSGESIADLLGELHDAYAVGVNCVAAPSVESQVRLLRDALPDHVRIIAYANVGYADDAGNWVITDAVDPTRYAQYAQCWIDAGATIIGGCCGTMPGTIQAIADRLILAR
ncbi:MAG: homocysteine S-methyltransferase family protein [Planctomycetes bacterium]|nr:homocysteine S-methyltransferase family protein [Planctomycetota bacterium]